MPWKDRINKALAGQDGYSLRLATQPIVAANSRLDAKPVFYEVLLRLVNPDGSVTNAGEFIDSIALDNGLMERVDWFVLKATAELIAKTNCTYAANLGAAVLRSPYFIQSLSNMLRSKDAAVGKLALEVTEREPLHSQELDNLRLLVHNHLVLLDDVGAISSRHSLFAYMGMDFVSGIKLDRNLISQVGTSWRHERIVANMFSLCSDLDHLCICECVEDRMTVDVLKRLARPFPSLKLYLQGYFIEKPQISL